MTNSQCQEQSYSYVDREWHFIRAKVQLPTLKTSQKEKKKKKLVWTLRFREKREERDTKLF